MGKRQQPQQSSKAKAGNDGGGGAGSSSGGATSIDALDDELLLLVIERAAFPARAQLARVSRRFRRLTEHPRWTHLVDGESLTLVDAVARAAPGDTLLLTAPFYQEAVVIDKPLRVIGAVAAGGARGGAGAPAPAAATTLFQQRPPVVLANARVLFRGLTLHCGTQRHELSIAVMGPDCFYMRFEDCRLLGATGLLVPAKKGIRARLDLRRCELADVLGGCAAVCANAGLLVMRDCLVRNSAIGVETSRFAYADLRRVNIMSNATAVHLEGSAALRDCALWCNMEVGCKETERLLQKAMSDAAARARAWRVATGAAAAAAAATPVANVGNGGNSRSRGRGSVDPWVALSPSVANWNSAGGGAALALASPAPPAAAAAAAVDGDEEEEAAATGAAAGAARRRRQPPRDGRALAAAAAALRSSTGSAAAVLRGAAAARGTKDDDVLDAGLRGAYMGERAEPHQATRNAASGLRLVRPPRGEGLQRASSVYDPPPLYFDVDNLLVAPPDVSYKTPAQRDARKRMRELCREVHGAGAAPDADWHVLGASDIDTSEGDDDGYEAASGSGEEEDDDDYDDDDLTMSEDIDAYDVSGGSSDAHTSGGSIDAMTGSSADIASGDEGSFSEDGSD